MTKTLGVAAAGHKETAKAAKLLLEAGGNAFDAALGAMCTACVCEPMLASLGGGGFLLTQTAGGEGQVFDFFTQTPAAVEGELDFYPIDADFGTTTQEFHIGMGSIAVPGVVAGLFSIHAACCTLPLQIIIEPAVQLARDGVRINAFQRYLSEVLEPIITATPTALALASAVNAPGRLAEIGEWIANPDLADTFEALVSHGPDWFYRGDLAQQLVSDCANHGGLINAADLNAYQVIQRQPVTQAAYGARISVNSPPSPGGCLIAFALSLLAKTRSGRPQWGSSRHAMALARVMQAADLVRSGYGAGLEAGLSAADLQEILAPEHLEFWHESLQTGAVIARGTTHISVADDAGNLASLTLSNGEGSAYVLPGSGIMLNNMLGEQDLHPNGFHRLPPGIRLASMMTPAIVRMPDGGQIALGSGGSNRIRSAILQVLCNLLEYGMDLEQAVTSPRLHLEGGRLNMEAGFSAGALKSLEAVWPGVEQWPQANLFFGGVHAVQCTAQGVFHAAGDPRRGGAISMAGFLCKDQG